MHNGSMKLFKWGILSWLSTEDWGINTLSWSIRHGCVGVCVIVASFWGKRGWVKCTWNSKVNYSIIRAISARDFNGIVSGCSAAADITSVLEHCTMIIGSKEKWPPKEYIPWNSQHLFPQPPWTTVSNHSPLHVLTFNVKNIFSYLPKPFNTRQEFHRS